MVSCKEKSQVVCWRKEGELLCRENLGNEDGNGARDGEILIIKLHALSYMRRVAKKFVPDFPYCLTENSNELFGQPNM